MDRRDRNDWILWWLTLVAVVWLSYWFYEQVRTEIATREQMSLVGAPANTLALAIANGRKIDDGND